MSKDGSRHANEEDAREVRSMPDACTILMTMQAAAEQDKSK